MGTFIITSQMRELREQLSHSKRIGCFFGAGTSMAMGLPGIWDLTTQTINKLDPIDKEKVEGILEHIKTHSFNGTNSTIEDLLNYIRMIRQVTYEKEEIEYLNINGKLAVDLDRKICKAIHTILLNKEDEISGQLNGLLSMQNFIAWYNWSGQDFSREIFTLNYDLIIEKSMESLQVPYFDGFIGAYEPFFHTQSVEEIEKDYRLPNSWSRLWKLHGSLGWYWKKEQNNTSRVVRLGAQQPTENLDELVIYPSKDKYESSRKQPFLTYLDRLRNYLRSGEIFFIIAGYSFSDEHINEVIFNGLKQNNRLHVVTFLYDDLSFQKIKTFAEKIPNLSLLGPKSAVIGGRYGEWEADDSLETIYWNIRDINGTPTKVCTLGDFNILVNYFLEISGRKIEVEKEIEESLKNTIPNPLSSDNGENNEA